MTNRTQHDAAVNQALGAFAVLISTVAILPNHPSLEPVQQLAEECRRKYIAACDALGITEQDYVAMRNPNRKEAQ